MPVTRDDSVLISARVRKESPVALRGLGDEVRLGGDPGDPPGRWVSGVHEAPPAGGESGGLARRRIRGGGRPARSLRARRERAANPSGHPWDQARPPRVTRPTRFARARGMQHSATWVLQGTTFCNPMSEVPPYHLSAQWARVRLKGSPRAPHCAEGDIPARGRDSRSRPPDPIHQPRIPIRSARRPLPAAMTRSRLAHALRSTMPGYRAMAGSCELTSASPPGSPPARA